MNGPTKYAIIDTETTGISIGYRHRIAEIAVVHLDPDGKTTGEWSTLLNPDRDLGPQAIHGIRAADVRRAPRFDQVAGDLIHLIRGRVIVAHNWPFDAMHLRAEFERIGIDTPLYAAAGLCTMRAAGQALPWARRSLIECCAAAGLANRNWHTARDDALAAADLLRHFLRVTPAAVSLTEEHLQAAAWTWPVLPRGQVMPVHRSPFGHVELHFLARLVDRIPRTGKPLVDSYLAMLDAALLDRQICATEADALLDLAHELGLHKAEVLDIHYNYLRELARAVWSDGVLTDEERRDVESVAALLALDLAVVEEVLIAERTTNATVRSPAPPPNVGGLRLRLGDKVVLTGQMQQGRAEISARASAAGLQTMTAVSGMTTVVVAADPDSLSGKAKDARRIGVPVVTECAFMQALADMS